MTYHYKLGICGVGGRDIIINYGVLKIVVLLCNWVKANYNKSSATIKCDEYGFTLMNLSSLIPISDASFAFPLHT